MQCLTRAGADDFLPVLIYVVIHANPPQLASNLEYIQRFRMHSQMVSESAYFFTQLVSGCSACTACLLSSHSPLLAFALKAACVKTVLETKGCRATSRGLRS